MSAPQQLFVTYEYIKAYSPLNGSVGPGLLRPSIWYAQDMDVAPWLGDRLYNKLKAEINNLQSPYLALMDDYIRPLMVPYTVLRAITSLSLKIDNGSIVQRTMEDAQPADENVLAAMRSEQLRIAEYYGRRLHDFLCANSGQFPEYTTNVHPERAPRRMSGPVSFGFSRSNTATGTPKYVNPVYKPKGV